MARGQRPLQGGLSVRVAGLSLAVAGMIAGSTAAEAFEIFGWRPFGGGPPKEDGFESPDARPRKSLAELVFAIRMLTAAPTCLKQ